MFIKYNNDLEHMSCDISFNEGDDITSAVLVSLLTDRRVTDEELQLYGDGVSKRGWWPDSSQQKWGSKLWLLRRRKMTEDILYQVEQYARESLQWLVDDGICHSIDCSAYMITHERIDLSVQLNRKPNNIVLKINDIYNRIK